MLRRVLDDAWEALSPRQQTQANKSIMAQELLKLAADGERDPTRLCEFAVRTVEAPDWSKKLLTVVLPTKAT
jgi:hypothetical protein